MIRWMQFLLSLQHMEGEDEQKKGPGLWASLGPGLITGSSDDDPSGILTYSQAGAAFGFGTLWTALLTFPLMAAIQGMCARIGIVTERGLTRTLKKHYSKPLLYVLVFFSFPAIILNISADLAGMGAACHLLVPGVHSNYFVFVFALSIVICLIYFPYEKISSVLKWLTLVLLVYLIVPFLVQQDIYSIVKATFIPDFHWSKDFIVVLVAILGTTISPYLFFWQASMEQEELHNKHLKTVAIQGALRKMRRDVNVGMFYSNLIMYFIILTTGSVLFRNGITSINTIEDAALALKPLAGEMAYLLFAVGLIGTGFLAIPVLAGSLSYILAETFGWKEGLYRKFSQAKGFYLTMVLSVMVGFAINFSNIDPIKALIFSAVVYGMTAPVLIAIIMHICNNKSIMGIHTNNRLSNILGGLTLLLMTGAAIALIITYAA